MANHPVSRILPAEWVKILVPYKGAIINMEFFHNFCFPPNFEQTNGIFLQCIVSQCCF